MVNYGAWEYVTYMHKQCILDSNAAAVLSAVSDGPDRCTLSQACTGSTTQLSRLHLNRGAYRASAAKWFHPESITAAGSEADPHFSKAKRVKLNKGSASGGAGSYSMQFKVPLQLAPVMLGFRLFIAGETKGAGRYLGPVGSRHFTIPVGLQAGHPLPQGAACPCCQVSRDRMFTAISEQKRCLHELTRPDVQTVKIHRYMLLSSHVCSLINT